MNLRDLEYALAVERLGSFTRAAQACDVSQPTLSGQVRKLEEALGVSLFERDGRAVRVTSGGTEVLACARRVVDAMTDLEAAAEAQRDPLRGRVRLGMIPTVAPSLLPLALPTIGRRLPRAIVAIVEDQTAGLLARLRDGTLDMALIATPPGDGFVELALFDEPLHVAAPPGHPFAQRETIAADELDPTTLMLLSDGHCLRDQVLAVCDAPELAANAPADVRAGSLETLLHLVAAGYGVTLVPALALSDEIERTIAIRALAGAGAARRVRLVARRSVPRRALLEQIAEAVREAVPADRVTVLRTPVMTSGMRGQAVEELRLS